MNQCQEIKPKTQNFDIRVVMHREGQNSKLKNLECQARKVYWCIFIPHLLANFKLRKSGTVA